MQVAHLPLTLALPGGTSLISTHFCIVHRWHMYIQFAFIPNMEALTSCLAPPQVVHLLASVNEPELDPWTYYKT